MAELQKKSDHTRKAFLKKLKQELEAAEMKHLSSYYDKDSLIKRKIINMMKGKKHTNLFLEDIKDDNKEDLDNLKAIDFISKTKSLKKGIGRINTQLTNFKELMRDKDFPAEKIRCK